MMALDEAPPVLAEAKSPEFLVQSMKELLGSITKTHLDPPLTVNDLDSELFDKIKPSGEVDDYYKSSLEAAHKAVLYDIAVCASVTSTTLAPAYTFHRSSKNKIPKMTRLLSTLQTSWISP